MNQRMTETKDGEIESALVKAGEVEHTETKRLADKVWNLALLGVVVGIVLMLFETSMALRILAMGAVFSVVAYVGWKEIFGSAKSDGN